MHDLAQTPRCVGCNCTAFLQRFDRRLRSCVVFEIGGEPTEPSFEDVGAADDDTRRRIDFVRHAGDEFAERCHFLRLDELRLRLLQLLERLRFELDLEILEAGGALLSEHFLFEQLERALVLERSLEVAARLVRARAPHEHERSWAWSWFFPRARELS